MADEFKYQYWKVDPIFEKATFKNLKIKILHRGKIKVFYKTSNDAHNDNYTDYNSDAMNLKGRIYPFTGLRGDAKELWKSIIGTGSKREKRVELVQADTDIDQQNEIKSSGVVIFATGYQTNQVPVIFSKTESQVYNSSGQFKQNGSYQYEVTSHKKVKFTEDCLHQHLRDKIDKEFNKTPPRHKKSKAKKKGDSDDE